MTDPASWVADPTAWLTWLLCVLEMNGWTREVSQPLSLPEPRPVPGQQAGGLEGRAATHALNLEGSAELLDMMADRCVYGVVQLCDGRRRRERRRTACIGGH